MIPSGARFIQVTVVQLKLRTLSNAFQFKVK